MHGGATSGVHSSSVSPCQADIGSPTYPSSPPPTHPPTQASQLTMATSISGSRPQMENTSSATCLGWG